MIVKQVLLLKREKEIIMTSVILIKVLHLVYFILLMLHLEYVSSNSSVVSGIQNGNVYESYTNSGKFKSLAYLNI